MADVVVAISVKRAKAKFVGWHCERARTASRSVVQSVGIGITGKECEPMCGPLVHRYLQGVVSGKCPVPELNYIVKVRKFLRIRSGCSFIRGERRLDKSVLDAMAVRWSAGDAIGSRAYSAWEERTWVVPPRAERRLINVRLRLFVKATVANICHV